MTDTLRKTCTSSPRVDLDASDDALIKEVMEDRGIRTKAAAFRWLLRTFKNRTAEKRRKTKP